MKFFLASFCIGILFSCTTTNNKPLSIEFSADSSQIVVKDIDEAGLFKIKNNIQTDTAYQKLVSVLQTPADDDSTSMEMEWEGNLTLKGNELIFTPKKPFAKGKTYLVESILKAEFASGEDIIKNNVGTQVKMQQKTLKR